MIFHSVTSLHDLFEKQPAINETLTKVIVIYQGSFKVKERSCFFSDYRFAAFRPLEYTCKNVLFTVLEIQLLKQKRTRITVV